LSMLVEDLWPPIPRWEKFQSSLGFEITIEKLIHGTALGEPVKDTVIVRLLTRTPSLSIATFRAGSPRKESPCRMEFESIAT